MESSPISKPKRGKKVIFISLPMVLIFAIGGALLYILPKNYTSNLVANIDKSFSDLRDSSTSVKSSMESIHTLVTTQVSNTDSAPLQTSGLLIHPKVASLNLEANILGVSIDSVSLIEGEAKFISSSVKGLAKPSSGKNVAGAELAAESPVTTRFRQLKDETSKADQSITKAQFDLSSLNLQEKTSSPLVLPSSKTKLASLKGLSDDATTYFTEAKKISSYYSVLSDDLLALNPKIESFKSSFSSALAIIQKINSSSDLGPADFRSLLSQAQVYLDQSHKDTQDLKDLSSRLSQINPDDLPTKSEAYHKHNLAVLDTVTTYFASESGVLQEFIDSSNTLLNKASSGQVNSSDVITYRNDILAGSNTATLAETKFASDLQSLVGEEQTLTLNFWQDNPVILAGQKVEGEINSSQKTLDELKSENRLPWSK